MASASADTQDIKARDNQACQTADVFTKLFYDRMDTKRHAMSKMYLEGATLGWNGHRVEGPENIQKFLLALPSR